METDLPPKPEGSPVPAHRKPTHRPKILAAALGTALACSGVAFAVQDDSESLSSTPEPVTVTSAPASPTTSGSPAADERDVRPSRDARDERRDLEEKRAEKPAKPKATRPTPKPSEEPEPVVEAPTPKVTPQEPVETADTQVETQSPPKTRRTSDSGIVGGTNAARADAGLPALSVNSCLTDMAQRHAERIAAAQTLQHQDLNSVMRACGMNAAAENVAMNYDGPSSMVGQWLDSPGHRANLLSSRYSLIGVGTAQARDGSWYGVQVFGAS
jgi:uncharacterized protein YkwD